MKIGKATGPSGIVVEMIKAAGDEIRAPIAHLANQIVLEGKIPQIIDLNCYEGKCNPMSRDSYQGLKLIDHLLNSMIRSQVNIDDMQFGLEPG